MKTLLELILDFIQDNKKLPKWELIVTTDPVTLRGSYVPSAPGALHLLGLPQAQAEPLPKELIDEVGGFIVKNNVQEIALSIGSSASDDYERGATTYLQVLTLVAPDLLEFTLTRSNIPQTGICGETANKLSAILGGNELGPHDLEQLIEALEFKELPHVHAVVSVGTSHRFLIERVVSGNGEAQVTLLQSWVGRFSLARWIERGRVTWKLSEFIQALRLAFPSSRSYVDNAAYSALFNLDGQRTQSPHIASEVTATLYLSSDEKEVAAALAESTTQGKSRWGL
ncbi:hypothetical protein DAT35_21800 [Vitiosangium sp. GDMCC 1.1324]|nr:hypothetical protein DAT35_21800 [Vitiosangium sp. GDMCC 1.1324]